MKIVFLALLLFSGIHACAQKDTVVTYTEVIKVDSMSKEALYIRARDWFNTTFNSSKEVLQIQDKEACEISGKGDFKIYISHKSLGIENGYWLNYRFKVTIWTKDGRYKYEITDIDNYAASADGVMPFGILTSSNHTEVQYAMTSKKKMDGYFATANTLSKNQINDIVASLKGAMGKNATPDF